MLLRFAEEFLHCAVNLGGVTGAAWHRGDWFAGGFANDVVEDLFISGHGTSGEKATTWFEHAVHFAQGEGNILRVINCEASGHEIEVI